MQGERSSAVLLLQACRRIVYGLWHMRLQARVSGGRGWV